MDSEFKKEDELTSQFYISRRLTSRIKIYILSTRPPVINIKSFISHIYYIYLAEDIKKLKDRYSQTGEEMLAYVERAVSSAITELLIQGKYRGDPDGTVYIVNF